MKNILITSLGSNTSISVIKALKKFFKNEICLVGTDSNDISFCAGASMVDKFHQIPNVVKEEDKYEEKLLEIIDIEKIDCVIPIHDLEIIKCSKLSTLYPLLTFWAVNKLDIIELCSDKRLINSELEKIGIKVPKQYSSINNISINDLPIIIKPNKGVSSVGITVVRTAAELDFVKNVYSSDDDLIQQYVEGKEFTVDCYSQYVNEEFYGGCVRERVETKAGISTKGIVVNDEVLLSICKKIHEKLNYIGASNIQFIVSNNIPYFIEINPRFSGAGILSYEAGFNSPLFTINEVNENSLLEFSKIDIKYGLKMSRYWQEVFV